MTDDDRILKLELMLSTLLERLNKVEAKLMLKPVRRFVPPTVDEVRDYCKSRANCIDPEAFVDFYTQRGWKCGKGLAIKCWKAAVRTWERQAKQSSSSSIDEYNQRIKRLRDESRRRAAEESRRMAEIDRQERVNGIANAIGLNLKGIDETTD